MAKRKINKSQAIRDFLGNEPGATPKVIIEGLAKKGVKVSAALVSAVKYSPRASNGRRKKRGRRAGVSPNGSKVDFARLVEAKALAEKMGGISRARSALEMLAKLTT